MDIEGELVTTQGDGLAAKGLRELVRRSTGLDKPGEGSRSRAASVHGQLSRGLGLRTELICDRQIKPGDKSRSWYM